MTCPACGVDEATVEVRSDHDRVKICRRCATLLQLLSRLNCVVTQRRPLLELIRGSVDA